MTGPASPGAPAGGHASDDSASASIAEARWAWKWAVATLLVTCLPYLFAHAVAYPNEFFVGSLHLPDDSYVYMAWIRQASEGRLTFVDRFTTAAQHGGFFNLYFLLLGEVVRFTRLPLLLVFHAARVGFGIAFLVAAHRWLGRLLPDDRSRRAAYLFLCFGAGLGWLFPRVMLGSPTDLWQAETVPFLSLYLSPLFAAALWLMVVTFERLWAARESGRAGPAVGASIAALALANIHSYDVLIVWAVWAAYLLTLRVRRAPVRRCDVTAASMLFLLPMIGVWQQWRFYETEAVFRARALVPTPSAGLHWYLLGIGLLAPLGLYGAWRLAGRPESRDARLFLFAWVVAGLALPYAPVSFQRKLAMGLTIPWSILAGAGLAALAETRGWSEPRRWRVVLGIAVAASGLTPARWYVAAIRNVQSNWCEGDARLFLSADETAAIGWLSAHAHGGPVLAMPLQFLGTAGYLPALGGVSTYAGHWGETPDFADTVRRTLRFYSPQASDEERRSFLRRNGIRYVLWTFAERNSAAYGPGDRGAATPADLTQMAGLKPVFVRGDGAQRVVVFEVQ